MGGRGLGHSQGAQDEDVTFLRLVSLVCGLIAQEDASVRESCARGVGAAPAPNGQRLDSLQISRSAHHMGHINYSLEDLQREDGQIAEAVGRLSVYYNS